MPVYSVCVRHCLTLGLLCAALLGATPSGAQCPADINGDGLLTPGDFSAWITAYNAGDPLADQNFDGLVLPTDFTAWVTHWNEGCTLFDVADLTLGGATSAGISATFSRPVPARSPDGTDVPSNQPRYDSWALRVPTPRIDRTFTNVGGNMLHLGGGYAESGELVQFHRITVRGGIHNTIQATHGEDLHGDPAGPTPANARRFIGTIDSVASLEDWTVPMKPGDTLGPEAGEYFRGAWMVMGLARRDGATGVAIAVGNYTPDAGLSGSGGVGSKLDTVFCDLDMQTTSPNRVREWSSNVFILNSENEALFTAVDYSGGGNNESWAILIRATRPDASTPWTFGTPTVVLERAVTNLVDHFHNFGLARNSTTGLVSAFINTGDVIGDQSLYVRSIADLSNAAAYAGSYTYNGRSMSLAFADAPSSRWSGLEGWVAPSGVSSWTPTRNIFGRRAEDHDGGVPDWGAPQFVGCAPGPLRSQLLLGVDLNRGQGVVCYDVDTFDPLTESPYPEVWQRWGDSSQFGFAGGNAGMAMFTIATATPEAPDWYAASLSQTNFRGAFTPTSIMLGRVTPENRVVFVKVTQRVLSQTLVVTEDGQTIFCGSGPGVTDPLSRVTFLRPAELVRPRLLGAGFDQFQPLYAAGETILGSGVEAGLDQVKNSVISVLERRDGITARYATDADIAKLEQHGFALPGLGPVYYVTTDGTESQAVFVSGHDRPTIPICDEFASVLGPAFTAGIPEGLTHAEILFSILNDPAESQPRVLPMRLSFGDSGPSDTSVPGIDYSVLGIEGCDWLTFRFPVMETELNGLRLRVSSTNGNGANPGPGEVPASFYLQVIGATAGTDDAYPMGYAGPPNAEYTAVGVLNDTPLPLPDEVQRVNGLPASGTVVYHGIADPQGVDVEYYAQRQSAGLFIDHAFFSLVEDESNSIELGWRNGNTLFAKITANGATTFADLFNSSYLQRMDDLKIAIRYSEASVTIDAWHNGNRTKKVVTTGVPAFSSPSGVCGSPLLGKSIPMTVFSVSSIPVVLSNDLLFRAMETGDFARGNPAE